MKLPVTLLYHRIRPDCAGLPRAIDPLAGGNLDLRASDFEGVVPHRVADGDAVFGEKPLAPCSLRGAMVRMLAPRCERLVRVELDDCHPLAVGGGVLARGNNVGHRRGELIHAPAQLFDLALPTALEPRPEHDHDHAGLLCVPRRLRVLSDLHVVLHAEQPAIDVLGRPGGSSRHERRRLLHQHQLAVQTLQIFLLALQRVEAVRNGVPAGEVRMLPDEVDVVDARLALGHERLRRDAAPEVARVHRGLLQAWHDLVLAVVHVEPQAVIEQPAEEVERAAVDAPLEVLAVAEDAADARLDPAPSALAVDVLLQPLRLVARDQDRKRVRLVAVAQLRDEIGTILGLLPVVQIPGEIPRRPPEVEALEQPLLNLVAPAKVFDGRLRVLLPPPAREQGAREQRAGHRDRHWPRRPLAPIEQLRPQVLDRFLGADLGVPGILRPIDERTMGFGPARVHVDLDVAPSAYPLGVEVQRLGQFSRGSGARVRYRRRGFPARTPLIWIVPPAFTRLMAMAPCATTSSMSTSAPASRSSSVMPASVAAAGSCCRTAARSVCARSSTSRSTSPSARSSSFLTSARRSASVGSRSRDSISTRFHFL